MDIKNKILIIIGNLLFNIVISYILFPALVMAIWNSFFINLIPNLTTINFIQALIIKIFVKLLTNNYAGGIELNLLESEDDIGE